MCVCVCEKNWPRPRSQSSAWACEHQLVPVTCVEQLASDLQEARLDVKESLSSCACWSGGLLGRIGYLGMTWGLQSSVVPVEILEGSTVRGAAGTHTFLENWRGKGREMRELARPRQLRLQEKASKAILSQTPNPGQSRLQLLEENKPLFPLLLPPLCGATSAPTWAAGPQFATWWPAWSSGSDSVWIACHTFRGLRGSPGNTEGLALNGCGAALLS